jgi:FixJ family two-component response regulator
VSTTNTIISVVDDDQSMSRMLCRVLTSAGFTVKSFTSAEEFLDSRGFTDSACLILDMNLPGMSGDELQWILNGRGFDLPIIFISADADEAIQKRVLDSGAVAFLDKPFNIDILLDKIRSIPIPTLS